MRRRRRDPGGSATRIAFDAVATAQTMFRRSRSSQRHGAEVLFTGARRMSEPSSRPRLRRPSASRPSSRRSSSRATSSRSRASSASGKTTFVRGACRALGVQGPVTSPTFTIGHRYRGDVDVSHLDLYRFESVSPAEWGDLEPYFDGAVCFVEWPEAAEGALPAPRFRVALRHAGGRPKDDRDRTC